MYLTEGGKAEGGKAERWQGNGNLRD